MVLTTEAENLIHLIARAFAKTNGISGPHVFANNLLAHARTEAAADEQKVATAATVVTAPVEAAGVAVEVKAETVVEKVEGTPAVVATEAETVLHKVESFISDLIHPAPDADPVAAASQALNQQPPVA